MPLFQIPRFVRLIARRLPVSPCFDQDLRENFRERDSFSLLDRNFLIHLYICVENCQYFSKRFDRIKNINSFSAVDLESSTNSSLSPNRALVPRIARLIRRRLSFVVLVGTN